MAHRRWSLARRLNRLFALSTTLLILTIAVTSSWFLSRSVRRSLDALLVEEIHEAKAGLESSDGSREAFQAMVRDFMQHHPTTPLAWCVWVDGVDEPWGEFGHDELFSEGVPARSPLDENHRVGNRHWRSERDGANHTIGVVVDGSKELALLNRYEVFAGILVLVSTLLGLLVGRHLLSRVARMLSRVAENVRAVRQPGEDVNVRLEGAPEEIHDVVEALHEMLENIRRETQRARLFTAGLAHELRSPIQNLIGETEIALMSDRDGEKYREILASHLEELRDLGDAVDNLVTVCSLRDRSDAVTEEFDLGEEARLRLAREDSRAEHRGVTLSIDTAGDLRMRGDREALLRALRNLAANAVEWSEPGGTVSVRVEGHDGRIVAAVEDSGPGVPEDLRERIFDPFVRAPAANGRRVGYGLGLFLARSAVESQGGTIAVGDSSSGGARFEATLPRTPRPRPAASAQGRSLSRFDAIGVLADRAVARSTRFDS